MPVSCIAFHFPRGAQFRNEATSFPSALSFIRLPPSIDRDAVRYKSIHRGVCSSAVPRRNRTMLLSRILRGRNVRMDLFRRYCGRRPALWDHRVCTRARKTAALIAKNGGMPLRWLCTKEPRKRGASVLEQMCCSCIGVNGKSIVGRFPHVPREELLAGVAWPSAVRRTCVWLLAGQLILRRCPLLILDPF